MQGGEFLDLVGGNSTLRERLLELEAALTQTTDSSYHRCRHAVSVLRDLCRFLEAESQHHFWAEETLL